MKHLSKHILPIHILTSAVAVMTLVSCGADDIEPNTVSDCPAFSALIDGVHSRAVDDYWEREDKIGISGSNATNVCHLTIDGGEFFMVENPEQRIYFQSSGPEVFTAYYPYNSTRNASTGIINFSTADQAHQKNFDFLWATCEGSKTNPTVEFVFTHRMSKISLVFKNGQHMDISAINKIRLNDVVVQGIFDTTTGICKVNEAAPTASTTMSLTNVTEGEVVSPLFLIPQSVSAQPKLEIYTYDDQYFVCNLTIPDNELMAGYNYTYTITVNKTGLQVTGATLSDWIIENGDDSNASSADE